MLINKINHPNIILVDFFYEDGLFYVVRTYEDDYVIKILCSNIILFFISFIKL